jgi:hypothetical protein
MIIEKLKNSNRLTRQEIEEANYQVAHLLQLNELERRKIEGKLDKNWKCKCWFCLKYPESIEVIVPNFKSSLEILIRISFL